ncbi:Major cardiolipin synthase ClsA [compost metagenome]
MLIDREVAGVGSANLDNRSFRLNFEITLLTLDRRFADEVARMLEQDFEQARELLADDYKKVHRLQQLAMRVARLISPIL